MCHDLYAHSSPADTHKGGHHLARNPFDDIERKFDDIWKSARTDIPQVVRPGRSPDIEIIEEASSLLLTAEMFDVEREDIRVDVSPHRVVIQATRRAAWDQTKNVFQRPEVFHRAISLPAEVRPEEAEAHYNNGLLEVILPKRAVGGVGVYRVPAE